MKWIRETAKSNDKNWRQANIRFYSSLQNQFVIRAAVNFSCVHFIYFFFSHFQIIFSFLLQSRENLFNNRNRDYYSCLHVIDGMAMHISQMMTTKKNKRSYKKFERKKTKSLRNIELLWRMTSINIVDSLHWMEVASIYCLFAM